MLGHALNTEKSLQTRNESLQKMVHLLETELDRKKALNEALEGKVLHSEQEFEQYKVRAQSVLRQAKEKDSAIGVKAQELASLERVVQNLNEKIADLRYFLIHSCILNFFLFGIVEVCPFCLNSHGPPTSLHGQIFFKKQTCRGPCSAL